MVIFCLFLERCGVIDIEPVDFGIMVECVFRSCIDISRLRLFTCFIIVVVVVLLAVVIIVVAGGNNIGFLL